MNINIGFIGLLTILFITLKLTNVIAWSWFWVLSPLWIGFTATFGILFIVVIVYALCGCSGVNHKRYKCFRR